MEGRRAGLNLTAAQQAAIAARGNVLVVAGAGTGKTRTLVERCLACLLAERPRPSLEEILLVTFTEAAAAEMRQRIRARLEEESTQAPRDVHWQEQMALFETAHLGTIHSFCFELVRAHFYELELDPQLSILPEEEARLLAEETLDQILRAHYAGKGRAGSPGGAGSPQPAPSTVVSPPWPPPVDSTAVQQLIHAQMRGSDQPVRALVLRLHRYTQALPDPEVWLRTQTTVFANPEPVLWREWLSAAIAEWRTAGLSALDGSRGSNGVAEECFRILSALPAQPTPVQSAAALSEIIGAEENCPRGKKRHWVKPLEDFFEDCRFLVSLLPVPGQPDPLQQDWDWVRGQMAGLLGLAAEFAAAFTDAKRELGVLDFQDLEQYALRLLWDNATHQPTNVAREWRRQLRFVFVDEYQDVNAAQDRIIQALGRDGADANRFLVGDVKQSIYRFRLANPHIFQGYVERWRDGPAAVIPLQDNFRSRRGILGFVNSVSGFLMRRELGGIEYDEQAQLRFGERVAKGQSAPPPNGAVVELQLRIKGNSRDEAVDPQSSEIAPALADLEEAAKEARAVALRLLALKAAQHPVWDEGESRYRPVDWRDISILLRAPSNKAESYAKEFAQLDVPLQVARGGFYDSLEIADLLSLLQVLDNPLQDLPLLALLRSPLVGLTLDELARLRLAAPRTSFWTALVRWREVNEPRPEVQSAECKVQGAKCEVQNSQSPEAGKGDADRGSVPELLAKISLFLDRFARWRRLARRVALSRCLENILAETQYADWLATQPRGEQRCANIKRLLLLAQRFDQLQRKGLFRFLRFIEAQRRAETEPELTAVSVENAVRLMSIHQSKGLEFPVVVLADLGKPFNLADLRADIILDEQYGLSPRIKPPHTGKRYPSLPYWLAAGRQKRELLGEELRLLYVAMTRARDLLILSGSVSQQNFDRHWSRQEDSPVPPLQKARSVSDWLGAWFCETIPQPAPAVGESQLLRWRFQDDRALMAAPAAGVPEVAAPDAVPVLDAEAWRELEERFARPYPFRTSTRLPAKTSVTLLRRRAVSGEDDQEWGATFPLLRPRGGTWVPATIPMDESKPGGPGKTAAIDAGNAHHEFLQLVALERTLGESQLKQEAERLRRQGAIKAEYLALLDFRALAAFWESDLGRRIREQSAYVKRELAFTFRLDAAELATMTGESPDGVAPEDFVVVQGIADLAVILPQEIWLVDFKTDRLPPAEEDETTRAYVRQVRLYARGLSVIYKRPVTEAWLRYLAAEKSVPVALV